MLKLVLKISAIIFLSLLQLALFSKFSIFNAVPNFIVIFALIFTIRSSLENALFIAFIGGVFLDLISPLRFGFFSLTLTAIVLLLNYFIQKTIAQPNRFNVFLIIFFSFLISYLLIMLMVQVLPSWEIVTSSLINAVWGILIYIYISDKIILKGETNVNF